MDVNQIAKEYALELLTREVDYMDLSEWLYDEHPDVGDATEESIDEIYDEVVAIIDTVYQRLEDEDN